MQGGFDGSSAQGAEGATHLYPDLPLLSSLNALSFAYHRDVRNSGSDSVSIHISVWLDGSSGFDNLVYNCFYDGDYQQSYDQNAMTGKWWSTHALVGLPDAQVQAVTPLQAIQAAYPNARIIQISVDNGDSSSGTTAATDFSAGVDNVLIGLGS
ncbi:MAG: hypothetical protein ABI317_07195, partial [Gaiellales bacterium]